MVLSFQRVLRYFELISVLKINFHKRSLVVLNADPSFLSSASSLLGCKVESLLIKYLGVPLINKRIVVSAWAPVVDRI